ELRVGRRQPAKNGGQPGQFAIVTGYAFPLHAARATLAEIGNGLRFLRPDQTFTLVHHAAPIALQVSEGFGRRARKFFVLNRTLCVQPPEHKGPPPNRGGPLLQNETGRRARLTPADQTRRIPRPFQGQESPPCRTRLW